MNRKKWIAAVILLLFLGTILWMAAARFQEARLQEAKRGTNEKKRPPVVVNVTPGKRLDLRDERNFSGTTRAWSSFDVAPKVGGRLLKLAFDTADAVPCGATVAMLDDEEYRQAVLEAQANLEYGRAQCEEAAIQSELREREFKRQQDLLRDQATTVAQFQSAESALKSQRAIESMRRADVKRLEALLAAAQLRLDDTKIEVQWQSGGSETRYVGARYCDEGSLLSVGTPILSILELDRLKAYIPVIERDYRLLQLDQRVDLTTDAYPGRVFEGHVAVIPRELAENTRNAMVEIAIDNADLMLRPGMFVRAQVVFSEHQNAFCIPRNALLTKGTTLGVYTFEQIQKDAVENDGDLSGIVHFIPVQTGLSQGDLIEIVTPELAAPVVTVGQHLLTDGAEVKISALSRSQLIEARYAQTAGEKDANDTTEKAEAK